MCPIVMTHEGQGEEEEQITFQLKGSYAEDTVFETARALGWNVTVFELLNNGTIVVNATRLS